MATPLAASAQSGHSSHCSSAVFETCSSHHLFRKLSRTLLLLVSSDEKKKDLSSKVGNPQRATEASDAAKSNLVGGDVLGGSESASSRHIDSVDEFVSAMEKLKNGEHLTRSVP